MSRIRIRFLRCIGAAAAALACAGLSPLAAGLVEMPATVTGILAALAASRVLARLGRGHAIGFGGAFMTLGLGMVAVAASVSGVIMIMVGVGVLGFGAGMASTLTTDAIVSAAPRERSGAASAISETAYQLGAAFGILGSMQSALYRWFVALPADFDQVHGSTAGDSLSGTLGVLDLADPADAAVAEAAKTAFTHAMQITTVFALVLIAASAAVVWRVIPSPRPDRGSPRDR